MTFKPKLGIVLRGKRNTSKGERERDVENQSRNRNEGGVGKRGGTVRSVRCLGQPLQEAPRRRRVGC